MQGLNVSANLPPTPTPPPDTQPISLPKNWNEKLNLYGYAMHIFANTFCQRVLPYW